MKLTREASEGWLAHPMALAHGPPIWPKERRCAALADCFLKQERSNLVPHPKKDLFENHPDGLVVCKQLVLPSKTKPKNRTWLVWLRMMVEDLAGVNLQVHTLLGAASGQAAINPKQNWN